MRGQDHSQGMKAEGLDLALSRSALYEILALGFRPPTSEIFLRLGTGGQNLPLVDMASFVGSRTVSERPADLEERVRCLIGSVAEADLESLEASYRDLFGHTARPKVPPYETEYGEGSAWQQPHELSDIGGIYRAFGLRISGDSPERADHVSCECEFLSFLARKEAYALATADGPMCEETRKAQRIFLSDHLGNFAPALALAICKADPTGFYGALGDLLYDFITDECGRFGIQAGPDHLRFRSTELMDGCNRCE